MRGESNFYLYNLEDVFGAPGLNVVDHDGPHTQNKLLLILLLLVFGCFLRTENHRYLVANGAEIM